MKDKGFTLIELLVVIAIIGILASIVLVALGGARDQARDARITSEMGQLRSKAELIATENEDGYLQMDESNDGCSVDTEVQSLCDDIAEQCQNSDANCSEGVSIYANESEYCATAPLNSGDYYCVDSSGYADTSTTTSCSSDGDLCD